MKLPTAALVNLAEWILSCTSVRRNDAERLVSAGNKKTLKKRPSQSDRRS
jgi:hypothetical protein